MPEPSDDSPDLVTRALAWPASRWLLLLGIPFGVGFALVTPPLQTPDELRHLGRAFAVSEGTLAAQTVVDGEPCIEVPRALLALPARLGKGLQLHAERRQEPGRIAHELARFPQRCIRSDRLSAYEQWSLPYQEAWRNELRRGMEVVQSGETVAGATSFASGQGRHGAF